MSLLSQTKEICQYLGIRPQKRFGQNFLIEKNTQDKIIRLAEIAPGDLILEIGTGFGFLTKALAKEASFVITVEADKKILKFLENNFKDLPPHPESPSFKEDDERCGYKFPRKAPPFITGCGGLPNIELIEGDILNEKTQEKLRNFLFKKDYKVVANIPYQITSSLIRFFLTEINPPKQLILMVQKEVAKRLIARPPQMNLLALSVNFYAKVEILSYISRHNFWPRPKVDSALIKITTKNVQERLSVEEEDFFKIIKIGFSHKRKKLIGNLAGDLKIEKEKLIRIFSRLGWKEDLRAENLSLEEWVELLSQISNKNY